MTCAIEKARRSSIVFANLITSQRKPKSDFRHPRYICSNNVNIFADIYNSISIVGDFCEILRLLGGGSYIEKKWAWPSFFQCKTYPALNNVQAHPFPSHFLYLIIIGTLLESLSFSFLYSQFSPSLSLCECVVCLSVYLSVYLCIYICNPSHQIQI